MTEDGPPDMSALLAQAQRMQEQLMMAKDALAEAEVTGTAANGLVTARVNGTGDLIGLEIQPEAVDPNDTETLADMVVAAVRDANDNAQQLAADQLGGVTGELGLGSAGGAESDPPKGSGPIGF